jgi:molybdopterin molybdotransferase
MIPDERLFDDAFEHGDGSAMLHYSDALKEILPLIPVMEAEEESLPECIGRVSSEDIYADFDLPVSDVSIPDGYAVISDDIKDAGKGRPVRLKVDGTIRAGHGSAKRVERGRAIRIMTGSVIPQGADCVVRFEDTDEPVGRTGPNKTRPEEVKIYRAAAPGENIRCAGSNVKRGDLLMPAGTVVGPTQLSVLLSTGKTHAMVTRKPVVALMATGDELIGPGKPLPPGMVYNSNVVSLSALIRHYGGIPKIVGTARDNEASLVSRFGRCMGADAIVTSGGASEGDYDLVGPAIEKMGRVIFPGIDVGNRTATFGLIERERAGDKSAIPVFSLPGRPSGCLMSFVILVRHALLRMRGLADTRHPTVEAVCTDQIVSRNPKGFAKWTFLRKIDGRYFVTLNLADTPMDFVHIAKANSITMVPGSTIVRAGDRIDVMPLEWCC